MRNQASETIPQDRSPPAPSEEASPQPIALETAWQFGGQLLRSLGLDPKGVSALHIRCEAGALPLIEVTRVSQAGDGAAVARLLEAYDLVLTPKAALSGLAPEAGACEGAQVRATHRGVG